MDGSAAATAPWRPAINPALYRLWRDRTTVQLGLDPAIVLHDVDEVAAYLLHILDGAASEADVLATGAAAGYDVGELNRLLADLTAAGVLLDGVQTEFGGVGGPAEVDRLTPDLTALSLRRGPVGGDGLPARDQLRRRRRRAVVVHGATRIGVPLAATLAAAGVGQVGVHDVGEVAAADCAPGGLRPCDEGAPRSSAAAAAVQRAAPLVVTSVGSRLPDLVVLCRPWPDPGLVAGLQENRTAHLVATIRENTGVVGPLVRPGLSSCLRCLELHRTDRDPIWPRLLTQLEARGRRDGDPQDTALAQLVVGVAAVHALAHLDARGGPRPPGATSTAVEAASLELTLPDWRLRRRSWPPHPRCGCGHPGDGDTVEAGMMGP